MKKNRLFIFSSILIIISLFATAAACNLCGVPIEIGETTEETEVRTDTGQRSTNQGQSQSIEAPDDGNHPPIIEEIELMGMDVEVIEAEGGFEDIIYPGVEVPDAKFTIEVSDEDGDELQYSVFDSLGINFDVTIIDNNNAEFMWGFPDVIGEYTLTVEVSDGKGGIDTQSISMSIADIVAELDLPEDPPEDDGAADFVDPENNPPVISEDLIIMGPAGEVTDLYTNQVFELSVFVSDPDRDAVTRTWSAEAGEFHTNPNLERVHWKTPATPGNYLISLTVNDSRGGIVTESWTVTVQAH